MTPGRLAILIMTKLHSAGFLNTSNVNEPSKIIEEAIIERINYGDIKCIPDGDELTWMNPPKTDGHGDEFGC